MLLHSPELRNRFAMLNLHEADNMGHEGWINNYAVYTRCQEPKTLPTLLLTAPVRI